MFDAAQQGEYSVVSKALFSLENLEKLRIAIKELYPDLDINTVAGAGYNLIVSWRENDKAEAGI